MSDPKDNKVLNFLKGMGACTPAKQWAKIIKPPAEKPFEFAWGLCMEPFWMIRALLMANNNQPPVSVDAADVRDLAMKAVGLVSNELDAQFGKPAYDILWRYDDGQPNQDLSTALAMANQALSLAQGDPLPGHGKVSVEARAVLALVRAIQCYRAADDDLDSIIDAADNAVAFAGEAAFRRSDGNLDKAAWVSYRKALAESVRSNWVFIQDGSVRQVTENLEVLYAKPPAGSHETEEPKEAAGISTPNGDTSWYASTKGGTVWNAYGTDGSAAESRNATVHDNSTGTDTQGSSIAPTQGNDWGFAFSNLTSTDNVTLTVTITHTVGNPEAPSKTVTVG